MFPGSLMMGAKDRLLPLSVPYRFFATAVVFHVAAWLVLALAGPDASMDFRGGQGWVLAGLHLVTLGTLVTTAMGAAIQLLPVATRRQLGPVWACRLMYWLYVPGVALFTAGLGLPFAGLQHGGATLTVAGIAIFAWLVANNLRKVDDLPGVTRHTWMAMASLALLAVLGLLLVIDFTRGFLPDHAAMAAAHAVLAGYGFMGMLALGFATVLIPMFVLGPAVADAAVKRSALVTGLALAAGTLGTALGLPVLVAAGVVLGLVGLGLYLRAMQACMKHRMKKRLEPFFRLVWVALVVLPLGLLVALALALGAPADPWGTLWGFLLVFGWLLSFVTALLQRIMPFLASMHSSSLGGKPALLSHLAPKPPVDIHLACHSAALGLIGLGIIGGWDWPVRLGLYAGLAGSLAFGVFAFEVFRRYRSHMKAAAAANHGE